VKASCIVIGVALVLLVGERQGATAERGGVSCVGNHDPGGRRLSCRSAEAAQIRRAIARYCRGAWWTQKSHCRAIRPLVRPCPCAIDLHAAESPPYAWLGLDHRQDYMWLVVLEGRPGRWRVVGIEYDDLERP
jgi:hypothetical protein